MIPPVLVENAAIAMSVQLYFPTAWTSAHLATVPVDESLHALAATAAQPYAGELLDYYLALDDFTCCRLCLGLDLRVKGHAWTEHTGDHLWHFLGWFAGLERVLTQGPHCATATFVWDESTLYLERAGEALTLYDERCVAQAAQRGERPAGWYPITVPLWAFVAHLSQAGATYSALVEQMRADLTRRGCSAATMRALLAGHGDLPHPAKEDVALKCAIIWRETEIVRDPLDAVQRIWRAHGQGAG
jgi:hypothetical protein